MSRLLPRLLLLALPLVLVACGQGRDAQDVQEPAAAQVGTPDADGVLSVVGTDSLQWEPEALEAAAGELTFELTCGDAVNHDLAIGEDREVVAECAPGQSATGSISLEPGEYPFVCTVPGHESRMRGTLTVS